MKAIKMAKTDSATTYLTKITSVRDELASVGEIIPPTELVQITLNGLPKTWESFVDGNVGRENLLEWERLWDDCIQNEIRNNHLGAAKQGRRMTMWHCWQEVRRAKQRSKLLPVEAKAKVKVSNKTRRTIPKSNVGIVRN